MLLNEGIATQKKPSIQDKNDIFRAIDLHKVISKSDLGQSLIISNGLCIALETLPGTDAMIEFVKNFKNKIMLNNFSSLRMGFGFKLGADSRLITSLKIMEEKISVPISSTSLILKEDQGKVSKSELSLDYLIDGRGSLIRLVDDKDIAWHAGVSFWNSDRSLNKNSIGIEIQNKGEPSSYEKFKSKQIQKLIELILDLKNKYKVSDYHILGHSDISPDRKTDPGYLFPWALLKKNNIGLLPSRKIARKKTLKKLLCKYFRL